MTTQCPERDAGQSHELDAGECTYCGIAIVATDEDRREALNNADDDYPDAWITLALEDAYSLGGDA
jgi:hypothetical protein